MKIKITIMFFLLYGVSYAQEIIDVERKKVGFDEKELDLIFNNYKEIKNYDSITFIEAELLFNVDEFTDSLGIEFNHVDDFKTIFNSSDFNSIKGKYSSNVFYYQDFIVDHVDNLIEIEQIIQHGKAVGYKINNLLAKDQKVFLKNEILFYESNGISSIDSKYELDKRNLNLISKNKKQFNLSYFQSTNSFELINIEGNDFSYEIMNLTGELVAKVNSKKTRIIDLSSLSKGVYVIKVKDDINSNIELVKVVNL